MPEEENTEKGEEGSKRSVDTGWDITKLEGYKFDCENDVSCYYYAVAEGGWVDRSVKGNEDLAMIR